MNVQFKKGVLELCVLALLGRRDYYGYELAGTVDREISMAEGSVYPLLKRLKEDAAVETWLEESQEGPPRKYYRITEKGRTQLAGLVAEWHEFARAVSRVIGEEQA